MFQYISFRAAAAIILALLIVIIFGRKIIDFLRRKQIGEEIRDLGLEGQLQKRGTPTMGGVHHPDRHPHPDRCCSGDLDNVYVQLMLVSTVWLGLIGGLDDYIKVFRHRKEGLKGTLQDRRAGRPGHHRRHDDVALAATSSSARRSRSPYETGLLRCRRHGRARPCSATC